MTLGDVSWQREKMFKAVVRMSERAAAGAGAEVGFWIEGSGFWTEQDLKAIEKKKIAV